MFGLGFYEIAVIVIVALVFIRPRDIPRIMRRLGRAIRTANRQVDSIKRSMNDLSREVLRSDTTDDCDNPENDR